MKNTAELSASINNAATISALAGACYDLFTRKERDNGDRFTSYRDDLTPELEEIAQEISYAAHEPSNTLPDDDVYEAITSILSDLHQMDAETEEDAEDYLHEYADSACPVYNYDLSQWLNNDSSRGEYVEEARRNFGEPNSFWNGIQWGWMEWYREIQYAVLSHLSSLLEELNDQREEEEA